MIKGDDALTYRDPILPAWQDGYANAYAPIQINKELKLSLSRVYEHVSTLARWNRFYINTKIYYFAY